MGNNLLLEVDCEKAGLPKLYPKDYILGSLFIWQQESKGVMFFLKTYNANTGGGI